MSLELEPMRTRNTAFSVDILGNQCAPLQYIRELTQNSIEAIAETGVSGQILWSFDRPWFNSHGVRKLCITDNGKGMNGEDLRILMNQMFSSDKQQRLTENYGIGAKVAGLNHSPLGMIYQVWKEGRGYSGILMKDPEANVYGLLQHETQDGSLEPYIEVPADLMPQNKRCTITKHGSKVTLLGRVDEEDTYLPEGAVYGRNWLARYLNSRYYRLPESVELAVSCHLHKDVDGSPKYQIRMIKGMEFYNGKYSSFNGSLAIKGAIIHWWLLDELKNPRPEFPSVSNTASLYQNELYDYQEGNKRNLTRLHRFGLIHLVKRMVIYAEPTSEAVTTDPSRSFLSVGKAEMIPWDDWGDQFAANMPEQLQQLEEEASEKATDADLDNEADSILKRWMRNFEIPKYKVDVDAELEVSPPDDFGGNPDSGNPDDSRPGEDDSLVTPEGKDGSRLSDFIKRKGQKGTEAKSQEMIPKVEWVSPEDHPNLDDRAAAFVRIHNRLLINKEFRGFTQLVDSVLAEKGGNKPGAKATVEEMAKLHYQVSICETVIRIQMLKKGGRTWKQDQVDGALSELALTTSVMSHKLLHDRISTAVGHRMGKVIKKAAETETPLA